MHQARHFFGSPEADKLAIEMVGSPHFGATPGLGARYPRAPGLGASSSTSVPSDLRCRPGPACRCGRAARAPISGRVRSPSFVPCCSAGRSRRPLCCCASCGPSRSHWRPEEVLQPIYEGDPHQLLKIIRYPGRDRAEGDQEVGPHKDSGLLSLVLQDDRGGLQVEHGGRWLDAVPIPMPSWSYRRGAGARVEWLSPGHGAPGRRPARGNRPCLGRFLHERPPGCHDPAP